MLYYYIAEHLATYNEEHDNQYRAFGIGWYEQLKDCPPWVDTNTRGCPHPNGVIIAGSSKTEHGMKVRLLDLVKKEIKDLPDLSCPVTDVGMTYDDSTGVLTVAGGDQYDDRGESEVTNNVFQLSVSSSGATWSQLRNLNFKVTDPMLVNDDKYLYVLGGDANDAANLTCARKSKAARNGRWSYIKNLPTVGGFSMEHHYCNGKYGGALWYGNKVRVLTRRECLTYDNTNNTWDRTSYPDSSITHLTPIVHKRMIVASIERSNPPFTIERLDIKYGTWHHPTFRIVTPHESCIGAGRFTSVHKYSNFCDT